MNNEMIKPEPDSDGYIREYINSKMRDKNIVNSDQNFEEYKKIRHLFDQKDESGFKSIHEIGIDYEQTEVGLFIPAETTFIYKLFNDLILDDFIDPELLFVDAGSGDARVNHLAVLNGIKESVGIEYSSKIFGKSKLQTQEIEKREIIKKGSVKLIQGDFTKSETYTKNNIDINKIGTFFNYTNGWKGLLNFIDNNSPIGTKIIQIDEQFNTADRIINKISEHKHIELKKIIKYIYWKNKDEVEILTPELLEELKITNNEIENQYISLDISNSGQVSITDSDFRVMTVYLSEKVS